MNEKICEARPAAGTDAPPVPEGEKGALRRVRAREVRRDSAAGRRGGPGLGCEGGLEAAEQVLRAGLLQLGGSVLGRLLAADRATAARGCRAGMATRRNSLITGTRRSTRSSARSRLRAWYHCGACRHGLAPRDAELGMAGPPCPPGLPR